MGLLLRQNEVIVGAIEIRLENLPIAQELAGVEPAEEPEVGDQFVATVRGGKELDRREALNRENLLPGEGIGFRVQILVRVGERRYQLAELGERLGARGFGIGKHGKSRLNPGREFLESADHI